MPIEPQDKPQWGRQQPFGENLIGMIVGVVLMIIVAYVTHFVWNSWVQHGLGW